MGIKNIFLFIHIWAVGLQLLTCHCLYGQDTIYLKNPSFEDLPRAGTPYTPPIKGWRDCGLAEFPDQSPPDIHPVATGAWGVTLPAQDGNTYLGLVTRFDATYESLSQILNISLMPDKCYEFSGYLAQSDTYKSGTKRSYKNGQMELEDFTGPTQLLIWGGDELCDKRELLAESGAVQNHQWKLYEFVFAPKTEILSITIEAFYITPTNEAYNGHVLVDGLSPITEVECY